MASVCTLQCIPLQTQLLAQNLTAEGAGCCAGQESAQIAQMQEQLRLSDATALRRAEAAAAEAEAMMAEAMAQAQQAALQMRAEVERAILRHKTDTLPVRVFMTNS